MVNTIELAYFNIFNHGGLTLRITEEYVENGTPIWAFCVRLHSFGSPGPEVNFDFPLSPSIVDWAQGALGRLRNRMALYPQAEKLPLNQRIVTIQDGKDVPIGG